MASVSIALSIGKRFGTRNLGTLNFPRIFTRFWMKRQNSVSKTPPKCILHLLQHRRLSESLFRCRSTNCTLPGLNSIVSIIYCTLVHALSALYFKQDKNLYFSIFLFSILKGRIVQLKLFSKCSAQNNHISPISNNTFILSSKLL